MPKISPELLSVLRCPVTGSPLVQDGEELVTTAAGPAGEKLRYAIEDGIPLLLPPELLPAAAAAPGFQHDAGQPHTALAEAAAADAAQSDAARARAASRPADR